MEKIIETRKIKIFCPTHQSIFEIERSPRIVCEIKEHALSNDFPNSEFWEYCTDCQTFSPSKFGTGGKATNVCPHCERQTLLRFLCDECKIVSTDSGEDTKGKVFGIDAAQGIKPNCPGCGKSIGGAQIIKHKCADIGETILTQTAECPFCLKLTIEQAKPKQVETVGVADSSQCPNCGHWGIATRIACGKCGALINSMSAGIAAGSSTPKTQLLGSICPNCGAGNDAVNVFCSNCGQALKTSFQPNSQNITDSSFAANSAPSLENITSGTVSAGNVFEEAKTVEPIKTADNSKNVVLLGLAGLVIVGVLVGFLALNAKRSDYPANSNSTAATNSNKTTSNTASNRKSPTSNSASSSVRKQGRLLTNMNIRASSGQYGEPLGTHYEGAIVQILDEESFNTDDGRYSTWYRVRVLENGCDQKSGNGCGNNRQIYDDFGWMQAEIEDWMNAKYITIE